LQPGRPEKRHFAVKAALASTGSTPNAHPAASDSGRSAAPRDRDCPGSRRRFVPRPTTIPLWALHVLGETDTFLISLLLGVNFIAGVLTVIIWMKLDVKLGSRKAYMIAVIVTIIAFIPFLFISTYTMALIFMIFSGIGMGGMLYFIYLIVADPIDEDELNTGIRREGTFFGITNFFMRLSMILSIVTVSLVFSSTGWESYTPNPGADVIFGLKALVVIFPVSAMVVTLILLYFYPYTKERVAEMKSRLAELHKDKMERVKAE